MDWVKRKLRTFISKKLLVMAVATHAMYWQVLPPENWILVASVYLGADTYLRSIEKKEDQ